MTNTQTTDTQAALSQVSTQLWQELLPHIQYFDKANRDLVELAFTQMVMAHNTDQRKSGEFYIIHPVAATITLAEMKMDASTIVATLLHDVPEDTTVTLKDLAKDFSPEVIFLIEGVTKLSKIRYEGEQLYAENLRKMFVAISKDLRVVFIKLADRLHNLSTLTHLRPDKQYRIALESLEIYAPIAERLGISSLQNAIEDEAFQYVHRDIYNQFVTNSNIEIDRRNKILDRVLIKTKLVLTNHGLAPQKVYGRAKKYYSIFKKLDNKSDLTQIYDLVAIRIIVSNIDDCYYTLSCLQQEFEIINHRTKDYIARPKANGYQSLHLTAYDTESQTYFEFQIRTEDMHEFAEYGVAAHFAYKGQQRGQGSSQFVNTENLKWIKELVDIGQQELSPEEYLAKVRLDLFNDRIFVFTPKNHTIDLPTGSTPLDFAFRIHEDIGSRTIMAKVNNHIARLSDTLKNGDTVEILTDKRQRPNAHWLEWVKTKSARSHIKTYLKRGDRD